MLLGSAGGVCHGPSWVIERPTPFSITFRSARGLPGGLPRPAPTLKVQWASKVEICFIWGLPRGLPAIYMIYAYIYIYICIYVIRRAWHPSKSSKWSATGVCRAYSIAFEFKWELGSAKGSAGHYIHYQRPKKSAWQTPQLRVCHGVCHVDMRSIWDTCHKKITSLLL